jgi:hypothetical protein
MPGGLLWATSEKGGGGPCKPTPPDALGPFYQPGAPVRDRVGKGYVLRGVVRSADNCAPLAGARLEFWLAGPTANTTTPTGPRCFPARRAPTGLKATSRPNTLSGRPTFT